MKICILTPRYPIPENGGDVLRINNIARYLKSQGHTLVLVSFREKYQPENNNGLYDKVYTIRRHHFSSYFYSLLFMLRGRPLQCGYYHSTTYQRKLKAVIAEEQPELYIPHLLRMTPYLERLHLQDKTIVEMTDALSRSYIMSYKARGTWIKRIAYRLEKNLIKHYELHVLRHFPKVVLVSQIDINYLRAIEGEQSHSLVLHTNGVEFISTPSKKYDPMKICFLGNMRTLQNQDAVLHFVNDIFPLILKEQPEAKFYIVGAEPPDEIWRLGKHHANIVVTGQVPDLADAISDACVSIAPVQVAAGIQNKVLVTMSMGLPCIMTSLIAMAIPELEDGKSCMIRDKAQPFADACLQLMRNPKLRNDIALEGNLLTLKYYSWAERLRGYERMDEKA